MSKKVDLNAPRNNSENHKKSRMNHSFSHSLPQRNEKENNKLDNNLPNQNNQKDNEQNNKNDVNQNKENNKRRSSGFGRRVLNTITGRNNETGNQGIELDDKIRATIRTIRVIKFFPIILIIAPILIFLMLFVVLFSDESDTTNSGSNVGINGYAYYDGNICENVKINGELMDMDEYVAGVIANEVGGFPEESLKAFAVAARTYIVSTGTKVGNDRESCYYQAESSTASQTYSKSKTTDVYLKAAEDTRGLIITVNGSPSNFYDASCVYTANQAKAIDPSGNYNDDNYYIRYGELTIGGINFQTIPKNVISTTSIGSLNYYTNLAETRGACSGNHGYGMSQNGSWYLEAIENYDWEKIIDYYYNHEAELLSIYKGVGTVEYSSEYPIEPNNELYTNLQFLINESFSDFLSRNGTSIEAFNNYISSSVDSVGVGTRNAVITAAVNLIGSLAKSGVKLNYQWGGKYATYGVNPAWGTQTDMSWLCGPASYGSLYDSSICFNNYKWASFDCSGFVTWAVINGMKNANITQSQIFDSPPTDLKSNEAVCKPGGVLQSSGHIVLVVAIDDANKRYIVAESTGSRVDSGTGGVKLSYYAYDKAGYYCSNLDEIYGD